MEEHLLSERLITLIITVLTSSSVTGIITYYLNKRKSEADINKTLAEAEQIRINTLNSIISATNERLCKLEEENENLRKQIEILRKRNDYIDDLEKTNAELSFQVEALKERIFILESAIMKMMDSIKKYISTNGEQEKEMLIKILNELEGQGIG